MAWIVLSSEHRNTVVKPGGQLWKIWSPSDIPFLIKFGKSLIRTDELVPIDDPWALTTVQLVKENGVRFRCKKSAARDGMVEYTDFENRSIEEKLK